MRYGTRPVAAVGPAVAYVPAPMAKSSPRPVNGLVVFAGNAEPRAYGLGDPFSAILGVVSSIFTGNQQAKLEKSRIQAETENARLQAQAQLQVAQIQAQSYGQGLEYAYKAEQERAAVDRSRAMLEADVARGTLQTQRMAMIDAQATQLVANTQNGIFGLASVGLEEAGSTGRAFPRATMWGFVLLTGLVLMAVSPPKFGRKPAPLGKVAA